MFSLFLSQEKSEETLQKEAEAEKEKMVCLFNWAGYVTSPYVHVRERTIAVL